MDGVSLSLATRPLRRGVNRDRVSYGKKGHRVTFTEVGEARGSGGVWILVGRSKEILDKGHRKKGEP